MVTKRNQSQPIRNQPKKEGFIKDALIKSLTVYPLNPDLLPKEYTTPLLFLFINSTIISIIFMMLIRKFKGLPLGDNPTQIALSFIGITAFTFAFNSMICYIFSFLGSKILGKDHSPKQFSINASAFTYISFSYLLSCIIPKEIYYFISFGFVLLSAYYIEMNYNSYYNENDSRTRTLHGIYVFVGFSALLHSAAWIPELGFNFLASLYLKLNF